jgi:hypothetical protein
MGLLLFERSETDAVLGSSLQQRVKQNAKHTAAGIPTWSPTVVLICRSTAYVWQSGRDAQFSADCGRMCLIDDFVCIYLIAIYRESLTCTHLTHVSLSNSRNVSTECSRNRLRPKWSPASLLFENTA